MYPGLDHRCTDGMESMGLWGLGMGYVGTGTELYEGVLVQTCDDACSIACRCVRELGLFTDECDYAVATGEWNSNR